MASSGRLVPSRCVRPSLIALTSYIARQRWVLGSSGLNLAALSVLSLHLTAAPRVLCAGSANPCAALTALDKRWMAGLAPAAIRLLFVGPAASAAPFRLGLSAFRAWQHVSWSSRCIAGQYLQTEACLLRTPLQGPHSHTVHNITALSVAVRPVKSMAGPSFSRSCLRACCSVFPSLLPGHAPQSVWGPAPVEQGEVLGAVAAGDRQVLQLRHDLRAARHDQAAEERDRGLLHPQRGTYGPASQCSFEPPALTLCLFTGAVCLEGRHCAVAGPSCA